MAVFSFNSLLPFSSDPLTDPKISQADFQGYAPYITVNFLLAQSASLWEDSGFNAWGVDQLDGEFLLPICKLAPSLYHSFYEDSSFF